jgi:signal transduction histidine kinase
MEVVYPLAVSSLTNQSAPIVYRLPLDTGEVTADLAVSSDKVNRVVWCENIVWFCQLRWIVVAFLLVAAGVACFPDLVALIGVHLPRGSLLLTALVLGVLNGVYLLLIPSEHANLPWIRFLLWMEIIADMVVLTRVVHFLGSMETPAPFMYLFHIILACEFLPPRQSLLVVVAASLLFSGLLCLEATRVVHPETVLLDSTLQARDFFSGRFWFYHLMPIFGIWGIIWYLASRLASTLREHEAKLAQSNIRLEASSDERARHMLQTTHQLKAPFAAIHANAQLLLSGTCGPLPEAAKSVVERISSRCAMLSQQILDMLQLSNLRSASQSDFVVIKLDLVDLLSASIARIEPSAQLRGIRIEARLQAVTVSAVEDHLRMLVDNLLTNAVHYSYEYGIVEVACGPLPDGLAYVKMRDHGIGIPAEKLPHIFEEFYRTSEASRHNQSSTGLGLAIVRDVAQLSNIDVQVESAPGWGTLFSLAIPLNRSDRGKKNGFPLDRR